MGPDNLASRNGDPVSPKPVPATEQPGPASTLRLTVAERVRRRQDYQAVYEHGTRLSGSLMTVFFYRNTLGHARLGIAATRKIGPAVGRNRAKRRVRDIFRRHKLDESVDIVVIPRKELIGAPMARVEAEYCGILKRRKRTARG